MTDKPLQLYKIQTLKGESWEDNGDTPFPSSYAAKQAAKNRGLEFGTYRAHPITPNNGEDNAN